MDIFEDLQGSPGIEYTILESLAIILAIFNVACGLYILIILAKYKRFRTSTYFLIFNFELACTLYILYHVVYYIALIMSSSKLYGENHLESVKKQLLEQYRNLFCGFWKVRDSCILLILSFAHFIIFDWLLSAYWNKSFPKLKVAYKLLAALVYLVIISSAIANISTECEAKTTYALYYVYISCVLLAFCSSMTLCWFRPHTKTTSLAIVSMVLYLFIPYFVLDTVYWYYKVRDRHEGANKAALFRIVMSWFVCYTPISIGAILRKHNEMFKIALDGLMSKEYITVEEQNELDATTED